MRPQTMQAQVTAAESKNLKKGNRVCWRGDAADSGRITRTSWDAVTIAWDNGHVATVHHGDMREIHSRLANPKGV
jgi:preprotein translocase subunit YajC